MGRRRREQKQVQQGRINNQHDVGECEKKSRSQRRRHQNFCSRKVGHGHLFLLSLMIVVFLCMFMVPVNGQVECIQEGGWGSGVGADAGSKTVTIPSDWVNDGYCDCPLDGADELETSACSGSTVGGWAGITSGEDQDGSGVLYQCPQQKKKKIPVSRMNDGICDCCDGSDENNGELVVCSDICEEVLAKEREERAKLKKEFKIGYDKRKKEIEKFEELVQETYKQMNTIHVDLEKVETNITHVSSLIHQWRSMFLQQRLERVNQIVSSFAYSSGSHSELNGLFDSLSNEQLIQFMIHSCQMAGEIIQQSSPTGTTCIPLRLAGIDAAFLWDDENILYAGTEVSFNRVDTNDATQRNKLSEVLHWNAFHEADKVWKSEQIAKRNKKSRRLSSYDDDEHDDYDDDYDPMYDDYYEDDDDYDEDKYKRYAPPGGKDTPRKKELVQAIQQITAFSNSRISFVKHASDVINTIDDILKEKDDADDKDQPSGDDADQENNDVDHSSSENASDDINIDPMAFQMVKNTLARRIKSIETGYAYAASAKLLLDSVSQQQQSSLRNDLISLAVGTLFHSQLSTVHLWQILVAVLPELKNVDDSLYQQQQQQQQAQQDTCSMPDYNYWQTLSCPPRTTQRNAIHDDSGITTETIVAYPPSPIVQSVQLRCSNDASVLASLYSLSSSWCTAATAGTTESLLSSIPTTIPDGYYGYFETKKRNDDDILTRFFKDWETIIPADTSDHLESLDNAVAELLKYKETHQKKMKELRENIGGVGDNNDYDGGRTLKFGLQGELHSLKDQCHSVEAGKYIYEVCLFGRASQKDRDKPNLQGTSLGQWTGYQFFDKTLDGEATTDQRVMKWENGQACWNGPRRSATVFVTCGAETKVLSAEEPDTCRYLLQMESHIACDDTYRALHDL